MKTREEFLAYKRDKGKIHYQKHKKQVNFRNTLNNTKLRKLVLSYYSDGKLNCNCCGETTYEFLGIDHIKKETKVITGKQSGAKLYRWLVNNYFPSGFQVLCHNCNLAKGFYGQCPHKNVVQPDHKI